jgi:hypothetical protein
MFIQRFLSKRRHILALLICLVVIAIVFAFTPGVRNKDKSFEFTGNVKEISDGFISVEGRYIVEGKELSRDPVLVRVQVQPQTSISRTVLTLPSQEKLAETGGQFNVDDLEQTTGSAVFNDIKQDFSGSAIGMKVKSNSNILGEISFTALEISYRTAKR